MYRYLAASETTPGDDGRRQHGACRHLAMRQHPIDKEVDADGGNDCRSFHQHEAQALEDEVLGSGESFQEAKVLSRQSDRQHGQTSASQC